MVVAGELMGMISDVVNGDGENIWAQTENRNKKFQ